ncbi:MAG: PRC-barrel domain-containing protein [Candidatus Nanoarchaeia archaeon]|nr:PRC-barrel domain-containing protein [Candidatus Nanoarchaeia archaeon]
MLKLKRITDVYEMKVFDDMGNYMGDIEEAILSANKIFGWRIRATKSSSLNRILGGAKGVIVPHRFVKAIGDIMVVSKQAIPDYENEEAPQRTAPQEQISSGPTDPRLF